MQPPPGAQAKSATVWSFTRRVLALLGRQVTFLCSLHLLRLPLVCCYYFYVWIPLFFLALFLKYALIILQVSSRRSSSFKRLIKHYVAFHQTIINIIRKIRRSSLSELTEWILTTIYEVVFTIFDESAEDPSMYDVSNPLHFAELIGYMEMEEPHNPQQRRRDKRMRHLMHHNVPSRPFRASVRIHSYNSSHGSTPSHGSGSASAGHQHRGASDKQSLVDVTARWLRGKRQSWLRGGGAGTERHRHRQTATDADYVGGSRGTTGMMSGADRLMNTFGVRSRAGMRHMMNDGGAGDTATGSCSASGFSELWSEGETVSRTSVPRSPETLARVMDRSRDRVDSVVFFVRDKLRLEEQRQSHDENSRSMASRLLGKGKFGVFDPYHTNKAIELTAGLHCAGLREPLTRPGQTTPAPSPARRARVSLGSGGDGKDKDQDKELRSSPSSLDSLDSSAGVRSLWPASPPPPPRFFSTRAAIPLMQDAFVYFEYFIKSVSPGSLTSSSANRHVDDANRSPVVSLGLASCDFSLDAMVGDDDRSVGLGLFPEDSLHPCRLYLSGTISTNSSHHVVSKHLHPQGGAKAQEQTEAQQQNQQKGGRSSFEMLGGPQPSSGDRIGVLVYICGGHGGGGGSEQRQQGSSRSRSSFGKDPSTDCLFEGGDSGGRLRQNSLEGATNHQNNSNSNINCNSSIHFNQNCAGCTPRQAPPDLSTTPENNEYNYDFTHDEEYDDEEEEEEEEEGCAEARLATLLGQGLLDEDEEDEDEEDGMHVCFNLNGCPLHVPWPAVGQISEMPWGQTALYPTISFTVPATASHPSPPHPSSASSSNAPPVPPSSSFAPQQQLQTNNAVRDAAGKGGHFLGATVPFTSASSSSLSAATGCSTLHTENTVKIWGGFCVDDVQYKTREAIGAPPGVCVYCLDGSLLLAEEEDSHEEQ